MALEVRTGPRCWRAANNQRCSVWSDLTLAVHSTSRCIRRSDSPARTDEGVASRSCCGRLRARLRSHAAHATRREAPPTEPRTRPIAIISALLMAGGLVRFIAAPQVACVPLRAPRRRCSASTSSARLGRARHRPRREPPGKVVRGSRRPETKKLPSRVLLQRDKLGSDTD